MTRFDHLLAPGRIGGLELPNRVVMPAMDMNLCADGEITDGEIDHYAARAAGGTGLVITGTGAVAWPVGAASLHQPGFSDDRYIAGMARLADAVHAAGGRVAMQLCHHGKVRPGLAEQQLVGQPLARLRLVGDQTFVHGRFQHLGIRKPAHRQRR